MRRRDLIAAGFGRANGIPSGRKSNAGFLARGIRRTWLIPTSNDGIKAMAEVAANARSRKARSAGRAEHEATTPCQENGADRGNDADLDLDTESG